MSTPLDKDKDETILSLLASLRLNERGWVVVDDWDADLVAVGIATEHDPRRLVYVSTFNEQPGRYSYECEVPTGPDPTDYEVSESAEGVDFPALVGVLENHLTRITISPLTDADEATLQVWRANLEQEPVGEHPRLAIDLLKRIISAHREGRAFSIRHGDEMVGCVSLSFDPSCLNAIWLHPTHRGHGSARPALTYALDQMGIREVWQPDNPDIKRICKDLGITINGDEDPSWRCRRTRARPARRSGARPQRRRGSLPA